MHSLGVIAGQQREFQRAAELFADALAIDPNHAGALCNRGLALHELGQLDLALVSYELATKISPDFATAHCRRAKVLKDLRQFDAALASFDEALALNPSFVEALCGRGHVLRELGRLNSALASYDRAIAIRADYAEAHCNRGNILKELKRMDAALASYDRAIGIKPDYADAHCNRGVLLQELDRLDGALVCFSKALELQPKHTAAWLNRGFALFALGQPHTALDSYDQAIALNPAYAEAHSGRGNVLRQLNQFEPALESHGRAVGFKPDYAVGFINRGNVLVDLQRLDEAIASYERAIALDGNLAEAHFGKSIALLQAGDFERGWAEYEWRWKSQTTAALLSEHRVFSKPQWQGQLLLEGKSILLHAEQGLGDTLQFCRYVRLVADSGAAVLLEVQKPLVSLLTGLPGASRVIPVGSAIPPFDFHCPLMSLPFVLRTTLETLPASIPYLHSDAAKTQYWRSKLGKKTKPRIGLAWRGNPANLNDRNRSVSLPELLALLPREYQYVSLHKGVSESDAMTLRADARVLDLSAEQSDFSDAAAICALMDIVISVDTSLAHLSGALGKRTWILLAFNADWRWMSNTDESPWYPTARLYRQTRIGDWASVFGQLRTDLLGLFGPARPSS